MPMRTVLVVVLSMLLAAPAAAGRGGCGLLLPGSDAAPSGECAACHGLQSHSGHPYDLTYQGSVSPVGGRALRSREEALRRGMFLPDGQLRCVTCHDGRSPWRYFLRLPPGAALTHAVIPARPATYENTSQLPPVRPGDDVGRKPLCLGCHALD